MVKIELVNPRTVHVFSTEPWPQEVLRQSYRSVKLLRHDFGYSAVVELGRTRFQSVLLPSVLRTIGARVLGPDCNLNNLVHGFVFEDYTNGIVGITHQEVLQDIVCWAGVEYGACSHLRSVCGMDFDKNELSSIVRGIELYPHQVHGSLLLLTRLAAGLFFEMRCGKTITTLLALEVLARRKMIDGAVVIAPQPSINSDSQGWLWDYREHISDGVFNLVVVDSKTRSIDLPPNQPSIIFTHHDYFRSKSYKEVFRPWLFENARRMVLVVDESHRIKNHNTLRFRSVMEIAPFFKRYYLLTGTPIGNAIDDIWAQSVLLGMGEKMGPNITTFRKKFMFPHPSGFGYLPRRGSVPEIQKRLRSVSVVVKQSSVFKNLRVFREKYSYSMTPEMKSLYRTLQEELLLQVQQGEVKTVADALTRTLRLLQILSGFASDGKNVRFLDIFSSYRSRGKILVDILEDIDGKVVLWHQFNPDITVLRTLLERHTPRSSFVISGSTPPKVRREVIQEWESSMNGVLITKPTLLGEGVDLSSAKVAIYWNHGYSYIQRSQSESRILSPKRKGAAVVMSLYAPGTVEESVLHILERGKNVDQAIKSLDYYSKFIRGEALL